MNQYTKNSFFIFIIIACHSIFGMEHPQLQLETQKKQLVKHVNCSIMIPENRTQLVAYGMQTVHDAIFEYSNLQSSTKDPIIYLHVQMYNDHKPTDNSFCVLLPAKQFFNYTDGSKLRLHEPGKYKLFQNDPILKKTPLEIIATCTKNPNIEGNSFAEQFKNAMNEFYEDPGIPLVDVEHKDELEDAEIIITSAIVDISYTIHGPHTPTTGRIQQTFFKHGPNGCPDEKTFIQSMIDEKIVPLRSPLILTASEKEVPIKHKSYFRSLRNRELTGSFGKNS